MKLYCPYCGLSKNDRITCCAEADWVSWEDLYDDLKEIHELKDEDERLPKAE